MYVKAYCRIGFDYTVNTGLGLHNNARALWM